MAGDLLKEISGFNHGGESLSIPFSDEERSPDAAAWQTWFEQAKARGERAYLVENLYWRTLRDPDNLRDSLIYILARKHPDSIFDLISDFFHSPHARGNAYDFALAIRDANLPAQQRIELLVALFQRAPQVEHQPILCALARLDQKKATYFVLQLLDEFPADVEGEYEGCPEAELAIVVNSLDDERAWRTLLQAARGASVGLRLELLNNVAYRNANQRLRANRLALLAAFLNDETMATRSNVDNAGRPTRTPIAVRDLVTDALAWSLGIEPNPGRNRNADEWSALRDQVRERLKQEELPALE